MDCEHTWKEFQTETNMHGGYMIMKVCTKCYETNGYGFLNELHEVNYLNSMIE